MNLPYDFDCFIAAADKMLLTYGFKKTFKRRARGTKVERDFEIIHNERERMFRTPKHVAKYEELYATYYAIQRLE